MKSLFTFCRRGFIPSELFYGASCGRSLTTIHCETIEVMVWCQ